MLPAKTADQLWGWGEPMGRWLRRCLVISLVGGFIVALVGVALREITGLTLGKASWQDLSAIAWSGVAYGLVGLAYGLLTAPAARTCARWGAAAGLALLLTGAWLGHTLSSVLRIHSGSYLTVGALDFTLNSMGHVAGAVWVAHGGLLVVLGTSALGLWLCLLALLAVRRRFWVERREAGKWAGVGALFLLLTAGASYPEIAEAGKLHRVSTPELVFYASFESRAVVAAEDVKTERELLGPERGAETLWQAAAHAPTSSTNVLLLMLESVSTKYLGLTGGEPGLTPNLDSLAEAGMVWERAWATATHSNYAQMAVLSSLIPRRGAGFDTYARLDYPRVLLHDVLQPLGYRSASITSQDESWQGMDRFQRTGTPVHLSDARGAKGRRLNIGSERIRSDAETVTEALRWLRRSGSGPWSLYVNLQSTHFPYPLPVGAARPFRPDQPTGFEYLRYPESQRAAAINRYRNALRYVDAQVGRIRRHLERSGQLANTLWVVTSDHGELFQDHGLVTHGRSLYEGEARVPLLAHWPQGLRAGRSSLPVSTLDVLPTLIGLLGLPPHPAHQGRSLVEQTPNAGSGRPVVLNIQGLRRQEGIVCWPHKLIRDVDSARIELFDLSSDPEEQEELSSQLSARAEALSSLLSQIMARQDRYYRDDNQAERDEYFAPRLPHCPTGDAFPVP